LKQLHNIRILKHRFGASKVNDREGFRTYHKYGWKNHLKKLTFHELRDLRKKYGQTGKKPILRVTQSR